MATDSGKVELQLKAHEKNIYSLQGSIEALRKGADPGLAKRVSNLEDGMKDLEKRFAKLLLTVATMGENISKATSYEIEKELQSKYADREFVRSQVEKHMKAQTEAMDALENKRKKDLQEHEAGNARWQAAQKAEQKAVNDFLAKEARRVAKEQAMQAKDLALAQFKTLAEVRIATLEAQVKQLLAKNH